MVSEMEKMFWCLNVENEVQIFSNVEIQTNVNACVRIQLLKTLSTITGPARTMTLQTFSKKALWNNAWTKSLNMCTTFRWMDWFEAKEPFWGIHYFKIISLNFSKVSDWFCKWWVDMWCLQNWKHGIHIILNQDKILQADCKLQISYRN